MTSSKTRDQKMKTNSLQSTTNSTKDAGRGAVFGPSGKYSRCNYDGGEGRGLNVNALTALTVMTSVTWTEMQR